MLQLDNDQLMSENQKILGGACSIRLDEIKSG